MITSWCTSFCLQRSLLFVRVNFTLDVVAAVSRIFDRCLRLGFGLAEWRAPTSFGSLTDAL